MKSRIIAELVRRGEEDLAEDLLTTLVAAPKATSYEVTASMDVLVKNVKELAKKMKMTDEPKILVGRAAFIANTCGLILKFSKLDQQQYALPIMKASEQSMVSLGVDGEALSATAAFMSLAKIVAELMKRGETELAAELLAVGGNSRNDLTQNLFFMINQIEKQAEVQEEVILRRIAQSVIDPDVVGVGDEGNKRIAALKKLEADVTAAVKKIVAEVAKLKAATMRLP